MLSLKIDKWTTALSVLIAEIELVADERETTLKRRALMALDASVGTLRAVVIVLNIAKSRAEGAGTTD